MILLKNNLDIREKKLRYFKEYCNLVSEKHIIAYYVIRSG